MTTPSFDERAATWDDDPAKVERARVAAAAIAAAVPLRTSMRMLEYGAGTGLVTQAMRDQIGPVTLVDTSAGMRDVLQRKIAAGAIGDARVWDIDLSAGAAPSESFELIVTVMALHHVERLQNVLRAFAALLVPGGYLCIVDLDEEDGSFHGAGFQGHHGFDRAALASELTEAGFVDVNVRDCDEIVRDLDRYPLFLATCRRGASS